MRIFVVLASVILTSSPSSSFVVPGRKSPRFGRLVLGNNITFKTGLSGVRLIEIPNPTYLGTILVQTFPVSQQITSREEKVGEEEPKACENDWIQFPSNGNCYKLIDSHDDSSRRSWSDSRKYCLDLNADLASIGSLEENVFLETFVKSEAWIGGYKTGSSWKWTDGSDWRYDNWFNGHQPSKAREGGDKLLRYSNGLFEDASDEDKNKPFICQMS